MRVLVVVLALGLTGCGPSAATGQRAAVESEAARPGVPVLLPASLPQDHEFMGMAASSIGRDGNAQSRAMVFKPRPGASGAVTEVCVQEAGHQPCGDMVAAAAVRREHEHFEIVITLDPSDAHLKDFWEGVVFTRDLTQVHWLH